MTHEECTALLGAYALDAIDSQEARAVAAHIAHCHECLRELAQYRLVVTALETREPDQHERSGDDRAG